MHSSKILKGNDAEKVAFDYSPKGFQVRLPDSAKSFLRAEGERPESHFKINDLIAEQIGLNESQGKILEERIEKLALEKITEIQEEAYQKAYELGQEEGREKAYTDLREELSEKARSLSELLSKISELKKELIHYNEAHIVKLLTSVASKIAMQQIEVDQESILPVLLAAVQDAQNEENVVIKVSAEDLEFIDSLGEELKKTMGSMKNLKIEAQDGIQRGGCIIETNYGVIDATIEQRAERAWSHFHGKVPVVKEQVG